MKRALKEEYLEKAKELSREDAEKILSRMRRKLARRLDENDLTPLEAVARQLQKEDDDLAEWRARWAEIQERDSKKKK
ncbi:MAG TPA: hypothetical protein VL968_10155 [Rhodocyclaceae bacterium]|jgi:hypothetical protein|nr:hypothetical protein [Rhodocyclaceae bacterium]